MPHIKLKTTLPGPCSQQVLHRRTTSVTGALDQTHPVVVDHAHGALLQDLDGNILIDLVGGIGTLSLGHTPLDVVEAITEQARRFLHTSFSLVAYENYVQVCERLASLMPGGGDARVLLANSGAEAVENAIKIARRATGRSGVLVFEGAYHGRTNLTMGLTSKHHPSKTGFGPFAPEIYRLPLPNHQHAPPGMHPEAYTQWCCERLEDSLVTLNGGRALAAILIEPIQGEGGMVEVPARFLHKLREVCDRSGAVLISDEVQCGLGRTGKVWAIEHSGVTPDMVCTAKALAGGLPLSTVIGRTDLMEGGHVGGLGSTFGGNPVSCAAAKVVLEALTHPDTLQQATRIEHHIRSRFEPLLGRTVLHDVRGKGAMMALEFRSVGNTPSAQLASEIQHQVLQSGVLTLKCGPHGNALRLLPPLNIPLDVLEEGLQVLVEVVEGHPSCQKELQA